MRLFVLSLSSIALFSPVFSQTLDEISEFAEEICGDIPAGTYSRGNIKAKAQANIPLVAKLFGIDAEAGASIENEVYEGIPFEKLPESIPTEAMCKFELSKILLQRKTLTPEPEGEVDISDEFVGIGIDCNFDYTDIKIRVEEVALDALEGTDLKGLSEVPEEVLFETAVRILVTMLTQQLVAEGRSHELYRCEFTTTKLPLGVFYEATPFVPTNDGESRVVSVRTNVQRAMISHSDKEEFYFNWLWTLDSLGRWTPGEVLESEVTFPK